MSTRKATAVPFGRGLWPRGRAGSLLRTNRIASQGRRGSKAMSPLAWPVEHRGIDAARAGLAVMVLAAAGLAAHLGHPTVVELNVFRLINQLPNPLTAPLVGVMQLGALAAVPVIGLAVMVSGRHRVGAALIAAGATAWGASKFMQWLVDEEPPLRRIPEVLTHGSAVTSPGLAFPASHVAVAAALTMAATPYVGRSTRRVCWLVVGAIAVARVYVGLHFPIDVIGGLALGVAVGALINLVVGVPARGPSLAQLSRLLDTVDLKPLSIEMTDQPDHLRCRAAGGRDFLVKTLSWDRPDEGWLARVWRLAAYREVSGPTAPPSPSHRAEHEAHLSLLAERAGVRTPPLVLAHDVGHQTSVVVRRWVDAMPFPDLPVRLITDDVLVDAWGQLSVLHQAGIVHETRAPSPPPRRRRRSRVARRLGSCPCRLRTGGAGRGHCRVGGHPCQPGRRHPNN